MRDVSQNLKVFSKQMLLAPFAVLLLMKRRLKRNKFKVSANRILIKLMLLVFNHNIRT